MGTKRASLFFFMLLGFFSLNADAQLGGNGVFRFLNLPNSARIASMGNVLPMQNSAELDDAFANPSLLSAAHQNTLSLNYSNYIADINFGNIQYAFKVGAKKTVSTALMMINYGDFEEYDETAAATGANFSAADYLLNIGYGDVLYKNISYGINVKAIYGSYDIYRSFALATDLAFTYKDSSNTLATGLVLKNIGYQLDAFENQKERLPFEIALGMSKKLQFAPIRYHISYKHLQKFDLSYRNTGESSDIDLISGEQKKSRASFGSKLSQHFVFGAELLFSATFQIQGAYNLQQHKELSVEGLGGTAGLSFGFSVNLKKLSLSYAHSQLGSAGGNNYFSLNLKPDFFGKR
ncbi:type IX secretion system protein PorQ [Pelobium manganitolerans]|uniref:type IX secretion system protein PorQ n=1 Tax=Pelobium manganitolerans TaxID=1842495 RepID=UPI003FA3B2AE